MLKVFRFFKWVLVVLLLVVATALVGFWLYGYHARGSTSEAHLTYLKEVKQEFSPEAALSFDEDFYDKQVFFLGESHGFEVPQQLDLQLLKLLNQKAGLRYYLAEVDYSQAYFLNRYLENGNEEDLRLVFRFWTENSAQWGNQQFYNKIKAIRTYNLSLPEERRIKVIGVDRLQDQQVLIAHMNSLLSNAEASAAHAALKAYFSANWQEVLLKAADMSKELHRKDSCYQQTLGAEFFAFKHTLNNLQYKDKAVRRDSVMLLNLQTLHEELRLENEKLYGLWGMYHSYQASVNGTKPFAALIRESNLPYKEKVVTLVALMLDSEMMVPTNVIPASFRPQEKYVASGMGNFDGPMIFTYGIEDLKEASAPNTISLFRLNKPGSPYFGSERLIKSSSPVGSSLTPTASGVGVTDYFQYLFLIRNSNALSPLAAED